MFAQQRMLVNSPQGQWPSMASTSLLTKQKDGCLHYPKKFKKDKTKKMKNKTKAVKKTKV